ncbi:subunit 17 of mediator complex-domain-containing protein [Sporodiniella umbellata]|nr:subunit 17 of mediator complex-domain-containing protein [Sporodiniella umbellata]
MEGEPTNKKIKLSLEPFVDNKILDITNAGVEILKPEVPLAEKMMQTVDRVWFERGEWKNITEESLGESTTPGEKKKEPEDELVDIQDQIQAVPPGFDVNKLRESVVNKLLHAKSEIDVALDVINILAASHHASTAKDLVLPAGSLSATYVTKPKPTMKADLEAVQLNLGLKRKQQKQASNYLKNSASALKSIIEKEQDFWDEALNLRRHNWIMYANNAQQNNSFLIQYGFAEVGSDFNEASLGELKRADNNVELTVAHDQPRRVAVHTRHADSSLETSDQNKKKTVYYETEIKDIQGQLIQANSTVFDAELFSHVLEEAQTLNSNVHIGNDEIEINIDGDVELTISKLPVKFGKEEAKASKEICMVELAFRLLLLQRHNYNMWKKKARILSANHAIQQALTKKIEANTTSVTRTRTRIDLPKTVSILSPVLSFSRFWVQFDRIRLAVHSILCPFRRLGFSVHFKISTNEDNSKRLYPNYETMSLYFTISLHKGAHLQFALSQQSGAVSVTLPQATVVLQHVSELRVFLKREINIMCLSAICDIANDIIMVHRGRSTKKMVLWKLDRVDEVIHSSLCTQGDQWKHIDVQINHDETMQSFTVQFTVAAEPRQTYILENMQEHSVLTFKEKVAFVVQKIMSDQS